MIKETTFSAEATEELVTELTELWHQNDVVKFAQRIVNLRSAYRKGAVTHVLQKVNDRLPQTPEQQQYGFKLFENGDRIETIEAIYADGMHNKQLAKAHQTGEVVDSNHLGLNRYIAVQFDGQSHIVVANSAQFRKRTDAVFSEDHTPVETNQ